MRIATIGFALLLTVSASAQEPDLVEPDQLLKNADLIGREVTVDDRVRFFQSHRGPGGKQIYDELLLKRTEVVFRLPPGLRPDRPPRETVARVQGILRKEGRIVVCEVLSLEMLPADGLRLDKEIARLSPKDVSGRRRWADWAARRGKAFKDEALVERGRNLEIEAALIEVDRPGADPLALAKTARERNLGEEFASALARKAFLDRLKTAKTADDFAKLADEVKGFFPESADPGSGTGVDLGDWPKRIQVAPIAGYREAPTPVRRHFERRLLADVVQLGLEKQAAADPSKVLALAEEARTRLPDRPEVAAKLRDQGLAATESNVGGMRLSEVEALAKTFKEDGQSDRATKLFQSWLSNQRAKRLSNGDSDGRVLLASQYERLLNDKATAAVLLREALQIDPDSKSAADAFRRLGYRKSPEGQWVDARPSNPTPAPSSGSASVPAVSASGPSEDGLKGLTTRQVAAKFGSKPDKIVYTATQAATIEQWIYQRPKGVQVINFRHPRGGGRAVVVSVYAMP